MSIDVYIGSSTIPAGPSLFGPASSVTALNALDPSPTDQDVGIIRIGTSTDQIDLMLMWDDARGKWVSDEQVIFRLTDNFGPKALFSLGWPLGYSNTTVGYGQGAWSSSSSIRRLGDLWSAGLSLEYRSHAFLTPDSATGNPDCNIYWNLYNVAPADARTSMNAKPPATGWAQTGLLTGGGGNTAYYEWKSQDWATLQAPGATISTAGTGGTPSTPTNQGLYALICGFPSPGTANGNSRPIDALLALRFVA